MASRKKYEDVAMVRLDGDPDGTYLERTVFYKDGRKPFVDRIIGLTACEQSFRCGKLKITLEWSR